MSGLFSRIRNSVAPRAEEAPAPQPVPAPPAAPAGGLADRMVGMEMRLFNGVGSVAAGIRGRAGEAVDNVAGRVRGAVDAAKQKKDQLIDEAKEGVERVAQKARAKKEAAAQSIYEGADGMYNGVLRRVGPYVFRGEESDGEEDGHPAVPAPVPAAARPPVVNDGGPCDDDLELRMYGFQPGEQLGEVDISDLRLAPELLQHIIEIRASARLFAAIARPEESLEQQERFVTLFMNSARSALRMTVREGDKGLLVEYNEQRLIAIEKALAGFLVAHVDTLDRFFASEMISGRLGNTLQGQLSRSDDLLPAISLPIRNAKQTLTKIQRMESLSQEDRFVAMNGFVKEYVKADRLEELNELFDSMEEELGVKKVQKKSEQWFRMLDAGWKRRREELGN